MKKRISASSWPWGRTSPRQRSLDLLKMIERNQAQILIIEDQAREAVRRIRLNIDILQEQLRVTEDLAREEVRMENKNIAYELLAFGEDRISEVDEHDDQEKLGQELRKLLQELKEGSGAKIGEVRAIDDFLDSMDD